MARLFHRLRTMSVLVALLGGCGAVLITPAAPAAADATCTQKRGVLVVVDFGELGGGVQRGCAPGDPKTGLGALHSAGFKTHGTQQYGPSFMCRIDGKPGKAREKCVDTPPADAYWAYWHGGKSGWAQSQKAVTSYDPEPGAIEGWSFGDGQRPRVAAAAARSAPSSTAASPSASTSEPSHRARASATKNAEPAGSGGGPPTSTIIAVVVVVCGGLAAGLVAWRRRRAP